MITRYALWLQDVIKIDLDTSASMSPINQVACLGNQIIMSKIK